MPNRYLVKSLVIYNIKKYFIDISLTKDAKMFTIYAYDFDINSTSPGIVEKKYIERETLIGRDKDEIIYGYTVHH